MSSVSELPGVSSSALLIDSSIERVQDDFLMQSVSGELGGIKCENINLTTI